MSEVMQRALRAVKRQIFGPALKIPERKDLVRLGSRYGGWVLVNQDALSGCTLVSMGLGEDASFDVEFASRYGASAVIFDPTPRAVEHFRELKGHLGESASVSYSNGGSQPIESYDLSAITPGQLRLIPQAISDQSGIVRFFAPKDERHVSHSLVNFQNAYSTATPFIEVQAIAISEVAAFFDESETTVVKMDIEGAEILALPQLLESGWLPHQILVEYDELNFPSQRARRNFGKTHAQVLNAGYDLTYWDQRSCASYIRKT